VDKGVKVDGPRANGNLTIEHAVLADGFGNEPWTLIKLEPNRSCPNMRGPQRDETIYCMWVRVLDAVGEEG